MKIILETYNPHWPDSFEKIKTELTAFIGALNSRIEHIGSTSVEGLSAKPIIDILVGLNHESDLEKVVNPLTGKGYVYYEVYNAMMPYRRFFTKHKVSREALSLPSVIRDSAAIPSDTNEHNHRLAHVHILSYGSEHWLRHLAFRDYLRAHAGIRDEYQALKVRLSAQEWADGNDYNAAKDHFIKAEERKAVQWYLNLR